MLNWILNVLNRKMQEHATRHVPAKTKPRYFGDLKELFVQWCLDFLDNWILNSNFGFLW